MKNQKSPSPFDGWLFVEIVWHDAVSDNSWCSVSKTREVARITTRGWLIKKTPKAVTVAATFGGAEEEELEVNQILVIPRGWLESVTEIEIKPVRKVSLRTLK